MEQPATLFRKQVIENQRDSVWGEVVIKTPLSATVFTVAAASICIAAFAFLMTNDYARKQRVQGYITSSLGVIRVYPPQMGYFSEIFVTEQEYVKEGQILAVVTTPQTSAAGDAILPGQIAEIERQITTITQQIATARSLAELEREQLHSSKLRLASERGLKAKQASILTDRLQLSTNRQRRAATLREKKLLSESEFENTLEDHLREQEQHQQFLIELAKMDEALSNMRHQIAQIEKVTTEKVLSFEVQLSNLRSQRLELSGSHAIQIIAPVSGTVTGIQAQPGESVRIGKPVASILPEGQQFVAHLYVPSHAIGQVNLQQPVRLKFSAFPYQKYGIYHGHIAEVTRTVFRENEVDALVAIGEPSYRVTVLLDKQYVEAYNKTFDLQAGLTLDADIVYDERSLISWLLDPIYRIKG